MWGEEERFNHISVWYCFSQFENLSFPSATLRSYCFYENFLKLGSWIPSHKFWPQVWAANTDGAGVFNDVCWAKGTEKAWDDALRLKSLFFRDELESVFWGMKEEFSRIRALARAQADQLNKFNLRREPTTGIILLQYFLLKTMLYCLLTLCVDCVEIQFKIIHIFLLCRMPHNRVHLFDIAGTLRF